MKKKLLIVTDNDFLVYQPTILNLYDFLQAHFNVTIISFEPVVVGKLKDETRNIVYLKIPLRKLIQHLDYAIFLFLKLFKKIAPSVKYDYLLSKKAKRTVLKSRLGKTKSDVVIAVDVVALALSLKFFPSCHFLSLEIYPEDQKGLKKISTDKIQSVVIQNQLRYNHLFGHLKIRTFYIQNAPVFQEKAITHYKRDGLIWAGSIVKRFAVLECIEFIVHYPQYKIVLKGGGEEKTLQFIKEHYKDLIANGKLDIDQSYLAASMFIDFVSKFRIGFCFYDWDLINGSINYQTAPSGKLFMYLAAGTPVIACNIPGFQFVKEFNAGILIDDYEPLTIKSAIDTIENSYQAFQYGCYEAAQYYSFDKNTIPFVQFVLDTSS